MTYANAFVPSASCLYPLPLSADLQEFGDYALWFFRKIFEITLSGLRPGEPPSISEAEKKKRYLALIREQSALGFFEHRRLLLEAHKAGERALEGVQPGTIAALFAGGEFEKFLVSRLFQLRFKRMLPGLQSPEPTEATLVVYQVMQDAREQAGDLRVPVAFRDHTGEQERLAFERYRGLGEKWKLTPAFEISPAQLADLTLAFEEYRQSHEAHLRALDYWSEARGRAGLAGPEEPAQMEALKSARATAFKLEEVSLQQRIVIARLKAVTPR